MSSSLSRQSSAERFLFKRKISVNKKTILFTIELADRELFAKTLLAMEMARRGFRVYIGSFRAIHEVHRKVKSCIFFHKSAYRPRIRQYKKRMGAVVAILDEELGPAIPPDRIEDACYGRLRTLTRQYYDYVFTVGEGYRRRLEAMPNMAGINVIASGWPRIDLWREEFQMIHQDQMAKIRREHGEYLLFISSFGMTSKESYEYNLSAVDAKSEVDAVHASYAAFNNYVPLLRRLAKERGERIVIRPHTSESIDDWRALFSDCPNVRILREGDVTPWLLAASAVLTYRSTVALQAALNGIPVVQYMIDAEEGKDDAAVFKVSRCVETYEDVVAYLQAYRNQAGHEALKAQAIQQLAEEVSSLGGEMASSKIADVLANVDVQPQAEIRVHPVMRGLSYAWDRYKYFEHKMRKLLFRKYASYRPSRFEKIPNGIGVDEVGGIIRQLQKVSAHKMPEVSCRQVSTNLIVIEEP